MPPQGRHPVKTASAAPSSAITATGTGTAVDLRGASEIVAIQNVLAVLGTSPTFTCKLQLGTSATGPWTDITGAVFAQVTAAPNRQTLRVVNDAGNGFVRTSYSVGGTSPSFTAAVDLIGLSLRDSVLAEGI